MDLNQYGWKYYDLLSGSNSSQSQPLAQNPSPYGQMKSPKLESPPWSYSAPEVNGITYPMLIPPPPLPVPPPPISQSSFNQPLKYELNSTNPCEKPSAMKRSSRVNSKGSVASDCKIKINLNASRMSELASSVQSSTVTSSTDQTQGGQEDTHCKPPVRSTPTHTSTQSLDQQGHSTSAQAAFKRPQVIPSGQVVLPTSKGWVNNPIFQFDVPSSPRATPSPSPSPYPGIKLAPLYTLQSPRPVDPGPSSKRRKRSRSPSPPPDNLYSDPKGRFLEKLEPLNPPGRNPGMNQVSRNFMNRNPDEEIVQLLRDPGASGMQQVGHTLIKPVRQLPGISTPAEASSRPIEMLEVYPFGGVRNIRTPVDLYSKVGRSQKSRGRKGKGKGKGHGIGFHHNRSSNVNANEKLTQQLDKMAPQKIPHVYVVKNEPAKPMPRMDLQPRSGGTRSLGYSARRCKKCNGVSKRGHILWHGCKFPST